MFRFHEDIYEKFIARVIERTAAIKLGNPLDRTTMMGAQASLVQKEKILTYIKLGKEEGAEVLIGGEENHLEGNLAGGYYIKPTKLIKLRIVKFLTALNNETLLRNKKIQIKLSCDGTQLSRNVTIVNFVFSIINFTII